MVDELGETAARRLRKMAALNLSYVTILDYAASSGALPNPGIGYRTQV